MPESLYDPAEFGRESLIASGSALGYKILKRE
jgi:hypothetical protein